MLMLVSLVVTPCERVFIFDINSVGSSVIREHQTQYQKILISHASVTKKKNSIKLFVGKFQETVWDTWA